MNRAELVSEITELTGRPKTEVATTMKALFHAITGTLAKGDKVTLVGFGTFERRSRQARTGHNPRTMAPLRIAASRIPAFRPGQELKDIVNGQTRQKQWPGEQRKSSSLKKSAGKKSKKR